MEYYDKIKVIMVKLYLYRILLFSILAFLGYTLVNKTSNFYSFTLNIARTGLFQGVWVDIVACYALMAEFTCIALLLYKPKVGAVVSIFVMLSFSAYIIFLRTLGRYVICGCGGILNGLTFHWHILINFLIISSLIFIYHYESKKQ